MTPTSPLSRPAPPPGPATRRRRSAIPATRGRVPVGRRLQFADPRRASLTVLGVAASLLLVLVLGGIFAGAVDRVTYYIRSSPAEVFVSQAGVRTMHMSASALPADSAVEAQRVPGVAWASPIGFASGSVAGPDGRQLTYLVGYDTSTGRGGPTTLVAGRTPRLGEAVLDERAADALGIRLGTRFTVLGTPATAVGISSGGSSITNTTVFVDLDTFADMRGPQPAYLLVGTSAGADPARVARRLEQTLTGVTAQTRDEFAASEARVVTDMSADLLKMMSTIGLLIALAVIALGLMTATLNRLRDFAVLKALGSTTRRLAGAVAVQVAWTVALAATVATGTAVLLAAVLPSIAPAVDIVITPVSVVRLTVTTIVVGLTAALWPLRRIAVLDAATAFRETR